MCRECTNAYIWSRHRCRAVLLNTKVTVYILEIWTHSEVFLLRKKNVEGQRFMCIYYVCVCVLIVGWLNCCKCFFCTVCACVSSSIEISFLISCGILHYLIFFDMHAILLLSYCSCLGYASLEFLFSHNIPRHADFGFIRPFFCLLLLTLILFYIRAKLQVLEGRHQLRYSWSRLMILFGKNITIVITYLCQQPSTTATAPPPAPTKAVPQAQWVAIRFSPLMLSILFLFFIHLLFQGSSIKSCTGIWKNNSGVCTLFVDKYLTVHDLFLHNFPQNYELWNHYVNICISLSIQGMNCRCLML